MPLGRMLERQANAEFVGDADDGEDIIRAVRVRLERDLPICPVNDSLSIAGFVIFGDQELTVACAREILKRAPE